MNSINLVKTLSRNIFVNRNNSIINKSIRNLSFTKKLQNETKENIVYTNSDEWIYDNMKYKKIGLTQNAIDQLTELVYVDFLVEPGSDVKEDEEIVAIESVKATGTINAPFDLKLIDNNLGIEEDLSIVNDDPENINTSWFIKVTNN